MDNEPGHPSGAFHWRREACAYESRSLAGPGVEGRGGELWHWLEEVAGTRGDRWSPARALAAARRASTRPPIVSSAPATFWGPKPSSSSSQEATPPTIGTR